MWLRYQICHKHGLGSPEYVYLGKDPSESLIEDAKYEIKNGPDGDPDGIREPKWEIVTKLPRDVLDQKIKGAEHAVRAAEEWLAFLLQEAG